MIDNLENGGIQHRDENLNQSRYQQQQQQYQPAFDPQNFASYNNHSSVSNIAPQPQQQQPTQQQLAS